MNWTRLNAALLMVAILLLVYTQFFKRPPSQRFLLMQDNPYFAFDTKTGMLCKTVNETLHLRRLTPSEFMEQRQPPSFYDPRDISIPHCSDLVSK